MISRSRNPPIFSPFFFFRESSLNTRKDGKSSNNWFPWKFACSAVSNFKKEISENEILSKPFKNLAINNGLLRNWKHLFILDFLIVHYTVYRYFYNYLIIELFTNFKLFISIACTQNIECALKLLCIIFQFVFNILKYYTK